MSKVKILEVDKDIEVTEVIFDKSRVNTTPPGCVDIRFKHTCDDVYALDLVVCTVRWYGAPFDVSNKGFVDTLAWPISPDVFKLVHSVPRKELLQHG